MALNEYEQKIWDEMASGLEGDTVLEKVEKEEIVVPYSRRMIAGIGLIVVGFIAMIAAVAYTSTIAGLAAFLIAFAGSMTLVDALRFRVKKAGAPKNNKYFDEIWRRLNEK